MKKSTLISLIRHGQVNNPESLFYGRMPGYGLSDAGYAEAKRAALFLKKKSLAALFCSPLLRARQTAKEIGKFHSTIKIGVSRLLNEVNSAFEGRPMKEIEAQYGEVYASNDSRFDQPYDIFIRSRRFIARALKHYSGQHVAAVTHGDIIAFTLIGFMICPSHRNLKQILRSLVFQIPILQLAL